MPFIIWLNNCMNNKYQTWYNAVIQYAKSRPTPAGYTEVHHVLPRSMGGSNNPDNLVVLTAKEHFVCHLLLTKMYTGEDRRNMVYALWGMANQKNKSQQRHKLTSRQYASIRKQVAEALSETRKGQTPWNKGIPQPQTVKDKISAALQGKPSKNKGRTISPEWREKLRQANLGKKRSAESVAKQAATMTGTKRPPRNKTWSAKLGPKGLRLINNGEVSQFVKLDEIQQYLEQGWQLGRKRYSR